ncbi:MAG: succinylglutamate desuccinylase [Desulfobacca sp.]|uniref:succinylglutamate desuccinylase n=1 Tax=Desulfobacca sp. TaxID=2067990 RepID=UPI004049F8CC
MRSKIAVVLVLTLAVSILASAAFAEKLICISNKDLKGELTVGECLARGDKFAIVDKYGVPQVLEGEALAVFKALNPGALQMKAFGMGNIKAAPEIPVIQDRTP